MDCIAANACERRGVGWQWTKYRKLSSIKLNNFFQIASFQSLLHFKPSWVLFHTQRTKDALAWLKSYLSKRLQTTGVATSVSSPLLVTHGVPEGSNLGPMLFNLYTSDLLSVTKECETESYVDDTQNLFIYPTDRPGEWNFASSCWP